jgi:hypothetical protein
MKILMVLTSHHQLGAQASACIEQIDLSLAPIAGTQKNDTSSRAKLHRPLSTTDIRMSAKWG